MFFDVTQQADFSYVENFGLSPMLLTRLNHQLVDRKKGQTEEVSRFSCSDVCNMCTSTTKQMFRKEKCKREAVFPITV